MVAAEAMDAEHWRADQRRLREALRQRRGSAEASSGGDRPLVSVIVVAWNAADVLGRCLDHLFAQDYANREIVVVDDGSDDDTFGVAERASARAPLTLLRSKGNRGCPAARNLGVRAAGGEIVAFVDADGFAAPDWLTRIVAAFGDDPRTGGVASTVFYDDNPIVVNGAGGTVNRQGWAADLAMNESYEFAELATEALYPMGCGMAIRREALNRVGPFDDRMLNYYDDVDYGMRLWRAGYRVVVAADAWVDHEAAGGDSARKRLLCERHRMRVVLKHAPARSLATWAAFELRSVRAAARPVRAQKLRAIAWNVRRVASVIANRRRLRCAPHVPDRLVDPSWGDGFPAGLTQRLRPRPDCALSSVDMSDPAGQAQLVYGWFPSERADGRTYRWAGSRAAVLVSTDEPVERLRLEYGHAPVDIGSVFVLIRRAASSDPQAIAWQTELAWRYIARSVENHPVMLPSGDYEVVFGVEKGLGESLVDVRAIGFALARMSFEPSNEVPPGGIDMSSPSVEDQLVGGWFEPEQDASRSYRWAGRHSAVILRAAEDVGRVFMSFRFPPAVTDGLTVTVSDLASREVVCSNRIAWREGEWHDECFAWRLAPGRYLVEFDAEITWSNPGGLATELPPESRSLAFALSSFSLGGPL